MEIILGENCMTVFVQSGKELDRAVKILDQCHKESIIQTAKTFEITGTKTDLYHILYRFADAFFTITID